MGLYANNETVIALRNELMMRSAVSSPFLHALHWRPSGVIGFGAMLRSKCATQCVPMTRIQLQEPLGHPTQFCTSLHLCYPSGSSAGVVLLRGPQRVEKPLIGPIR